MHLKVSEPPIVLLVTFRVELYTQARSSIAKVLRIPINHYNPSFVRTLS